MSVALAKKAEHARLRRQIAEDNLAAARASKWKNFVNANLKPSLHRKEGWTTPAEAERDFSKYDRRKAMARARQLIEENPLVACIQRKRLDLICGDGPWLKMSSGDRGWDRAVEWWWEVTSRTIDIRSARSWNRLMRCVQARKDVDGDVGIFLYADDVETEDGVIPASYCQIIEGDRIERDPVKQPDEGIDFDEFGRATKFWVSSRDGKAKPKPYAARDFIFFARDSSERAERQRGMSLYLQTFNLLLDYADILEGIVLKVKAESCTGLKFTFDPATGSPLEIENEGDTPDWARARFQPGMNFVMPRGQDVDLIESKAPHAEFDEFEIKLVERIAAPCGLAYPLVTMDYSTFNFSSARAMRGEVRASIEPEQAELGGVASRIFFWALSRAIAGGSLPKPPESIKGTWGKHTWGFPRLEYLLKPTEEASAAGMLVERGLMTRTDYIAATSDADFDDVAERLGYEEKKLRESGATVVTTPGGAQPASDLTEDSSTEDPQKKDGTTE